MSLAERAAPRPGAGHGLHFSGREAFSRLSRSPTLRIPRGGGRSFHVATDRVRAVPALTPTLSGSLGMGAMGLGWWGMLAPKSVARFLGLNVSKTAVRTLFGARELYTGYTLAADPTKSDVLWMRVAGDLFDIAVLALADNRRNPKRDNVRMGAVARNCEGRGR